MKKFIIISLILCCFCSAHAQDSKECLDKLVEQGVELKSLQVQVQKFQKQIETFEKEKVETNKAFEKEKADANKAFEKKKVDLNKRIKKLDNEIIVLNKKINDLDKNTVKIERDNLRNEVNSMKAKVEELNGLIRKKNEAIAAEKRIGEQKAKEKDVISEQIAGILKLTVGSYQNKTFDDLITSSTQLSVVRDMQLAGDHAEVKTILTDLGKYFDAKKTLAQKFDPAQISRAQSLLNQINRQSDLIGNLKKDVEYYKFFYDALKKTIEEIVDLDGREKAGNDAEFQRIRFGKIMAILANYLYDYDGYVNYPYLSDIVLEINKRKKANADADIKDLLEKLK